MQFVQVKKEKSLLKDLQVCEIKIEKSSKAKYLESKLGTSWSFEIYNHLEPFFHLRACIDTDITLEPGEIFPFPTGIYPQLTNPNFTIEVNSLSGLIYSYGVVMCERVTYFPYTFRDEIWIHLENKNHEAVIIRPGQKIAQMTVKQLPRIVIKYVDEIEKSDWKINSGKTFIKLIKDQIRNRTKTKAIEQYSREKIMKLYGENNES
jgi:dUTP pyrophosphatase